MNLDANGNLTTQQFQLIPYNNLVYMIRAVSNVNALGVVGGLGAVVRAAGGHVRSDQDGQPRAGAGRPL